MTARSIALVCTLLFAWHRNAAAWSPGPYELTRCVKDFDIAVRGTVAKVEIVDNKPGGWVLSRALVTVERAYYGIGGNPKQLAFYFWSATDNKYTIAHALAPLDRILVFLSTNLEPVARMKRDKTTVYMVQFAKANHRGYLYTIVNDGKTDRVRDAVFSQDTRLTMSLAAAEAELARRKP